MTIDYIKGDKVIRLNPMRRTTAFAALGTVEAYWEGLRDGRLMPTRSDVDPRGIANVLEYAFVLEKIAPGLAKIRLGGMHLNELMAMEVRGMPVSALVLPEARRELQAVIASVFDEPAVVRLALSSERGFARAPLQAQMILLPLRDATGRPTRILGALQARGEIGRGPRRFAIRDIETKPLVGDPIAGHTIQPAPEWGPPAPATERPRAYAPRREALQRQLDEVMQAGDAADRGAGHLRLVFDADEG